MNIERKKNTIITTTQLLYINYSVDQRFSCSDSRLSRAFTAFEHAEPINLLNGIDRLFVFVQVYNIENKRGSENGGVKSRNGLTAELRRIIFKRLFGRFVNNVRYVLYLFELGADIVYARLRNILVQENNDPVFAADGIDYGVNVLNNKHRTAE